MHVGILGGTGPAGRALAARLASVGVEVTIGSRSAHRAAQMADELRRLWPDAHLAISSADNGGAASAELVVVATPWDAAAATAGSLSGKLAGKVVVSMANALAKVGPELQPLIPPRGSIAEGIQATLADSEVAAAFHHLPARDLGRIDTLLGADVLICSDHPRAIAETSELVRRIPGLRPLDAGSLSSAAALEAFTAVLANLNTRYRTRAAIKITGVADDRAGQGSDRAEPQPRSPRQR